MENRYETAKYQNNAENEVQNRLNAKVKGA